MNAKVPNEKTTAAVWWRTAHPPFPRGPESGTPPGQDHADPYLFPFLILTEQEAKCLEYDTFANTLTHQVSIGINLTGLSKHLKTSS